MATKKTAKKATKKKYTRKKTTRLKPIGTLVVDKHVREQEREALVIREVIPQTYKNQTGYDRLNAIPDYTERLKPNRIANILGNLFVMTREQLIELAKDKHLTVLEQNLIQMVKESLDESVKGKTEISKYLHSRTEGMPRKIVEFSGQVDQKLELQTKEIPDIDNMSYDELDSLEKLAKSLMNAPRKKVKIDQDDE